MRVAPEDNPKPALGLVYWTAVTVCAGCLALALYAVGIDLSIGRRDAGALSIRTLVGLIIPIGPAILAVAGAFWFRARGIVPSKFFRVSVVLIAFWTAWMSLAIWGV